MTAPPDLGGFTTALARLDGQITAAESAGQPVPPEARLMVDRLRELIAAISDLSATITPPAHSESSI